MVQHHRLIPDPAALPYMIGHRALMAANRQSTHHVGSVRIPTGTGRDLVFGTHARDGANWVDDTGVQLPLLDTSGIEAAISRADSQITQITNSQSFANNTVKKIQDTVSGMQSTLTSTAKTANSALTDVAKVQADLKGFETAVSQTYLPKSDAAKTYTTSSQVEQTAKQISAQVVSNYKGADGSGLATQSSLDATKKDILAQVSQTYTTKDGVTQQLNSKVQQTADSLTTTFTDQLNTVKTQASTTQTQVNSIQAMIREDSAGIHVGRLVDGKQSGYSTLVGSDGSFQVLDGAGASYATLKPLNLTLGTMDGDKGNCVMSVGPNGMGITYVQRNGHDGFGHDTYGMATGTGGININSPDGSWITAGTGGIGIQGSDGSHINIGPGGISIHASDGSDISVGKGGVHIGDPTGAHFNLQSTSIDIATHDGRQYIGVSDGGMSIKWQGRHQLATGPAAGELYLNSRQLRHV